MAISQTIADFVTLAIQAGGWMDLDRLYLQNRILGIIGENSMEEVVPSVVPDSSLTLVAELIQKAKENHIIDASSIAETEQLEALLMDFLTPPPSVVNAFFAQHYAKEPKEATDYFYQLCENNNYIKTQEIAKNKYFTVMTDYGELEITINLSKPEKDPKAIAAKQHEKENNTYPKCQLCMENEGYKGRVDYPARTNHRIIRMNIDGESWGFQYSPYAYYNEHSIILSEYHRPMKINQETFKRLIKIIEILPHYFVGSNADLPIVGGSILTHDHYQAGRHHFPMEKAETKKYIEWSEYPLMNIGIVDWPMSVVRLQSPNQEELISAATRILEKWQQYSNAELNIQAFSEDGTPHHTVTPIARRKENLFELDLVLRDNNTSKEYPDGIFHPHPDVQHIKKENIGLIEVMGLAILPPRLEQEMKEVIHYVLDQPNKIADYHLSWANQIKEQYSFTAENAEKIIEEEIGKVFARVLEDAGVFKNDQQGQAAFQAFLENL